MPIGQSENSNSPTSSHNNDFQHHSSDNAPQIEKTLIASDEKMLLAKLIEAADKFPSPDFSYNPASTANGASPRTQLIETIKSDHSVIYRGKSITKEEDIPRNLDHDLIFHPGLPQEGLETFQRYIDALVCQEFIRFRDNRHDFFITPSGKNHNNNSPLHAFSENKITSNTPRWPRKSPFCPHILVMKGGGVKGVAYVGALQVLEEYGYEFNHFVGTSAGAITAALLAVGYTSTELGEILAKTDFRKFKDGWLLLSLPLVLFRKGIYRGEKFRIWLEEYLREKFPRYTAAIPILFNHLKEVADGSRRLTVFASIKNRRSYPFDSQDPANSAIRISFACRCSMAIPYFFRPEKIQGQWVVDGGIQNNYPIYALLDNYPDLKNSSDFIGLYLGTKEAKQNPKWFFLDLWSIWSESGDEEAKVEFIDRTIVIDPRPIKTTDFSLSPNDVKFLLAEGKASALHWLHHWSEGERPTQNEVEEAEKISRELRELVISERWENLLLKLLSGFLIIALLAIFSYLFFLRKTPSTIIAIPSSIELL
jgi:predicted acylesterase/phospholipase RssA